MLRYAKWVVIVGAGVGGLSAGCYAQMNGYLSRIFEMADRPGGVCTSRSRNGYTIDDPIINLMGIGSGSHARNLWNELGALRDTEIVRHTELSRAVIPDGRTFALHADLDALEKEMVEIAPKDAHVIRRYCNAVRNLSDREPLALQMGDWKERMSLMPYRKWFDMSMGEFAGYFRDPFLRKVFPYMHNGDPDAPMIVNLANMGALSKGDLGWPVGGSSRIARNLEKRYLDLGGEIFYSSKVRKVIISNDDRAVGVALENGMRRGGDVIISAADGQNTIFNMCKVKHVTDEVRTYYEGAHLRCQEQGLQIALCVKRDLSDEPHFMVQFLSTPISIGGLERDRLNLQLYSSKMGMAPAGCGVIKITLRSSYDYWIGRRSEKGIYEAEKEKVVARVVQALEGVFPGITGQVETADICTAVTAEQLTGNYRGLSPWMPKGGMKLPLRNGLSRTLPDLINFYMAGQWAMGSKGLCSTAISGREAIRSLCMRERKRFVTSVVT
jgi:phytoene dehydrogenase-like protein